MAPYRVKICLPVLLKNRNTRRAADAVKAYLGGPPSESVLCLIFLSLSLIHKLDLPLAFILCVTGSVWI